MLNLTRIYPISEFKRHSDRFVNELGENGQPLVLTISGHPRLVVQGVAAYQALLERLRKAEELVEELNAMARQNRGPG